MAPPPMRRISDTRYESIDWPGWSLRLEPEGWAIYDREYFEQHVSLGEGTAEDALEFAMLWLPDVARERDRERKYPGYS